MNLGNEAQDSGVAQPAAAWIVGGDLNLDEAQLLQYSSFYVQPSTKCFSKSGVSPRTNWCKSDIAISKGIDLRHVEAWVGVNFSTQVSDAHDMVLVAGALDGMKQRLPPPANQGQKRSWSDVAASRATPQETQRREPARLVPTPPPPPMRSCPAPRDEQPPVAPAEPAEMQRGEPSSLEPALPRAPAPGDVALASDDSHLARYTPRSHRRAELCEISTGALLCEQRAADFWDASDSRGADEAVASVDEEVPAAQTVDPTTPECIDVAGQVISALSDRLDQHRAEQHSEAAGDLLLLLAN